LASRDTSKAKTGNLKDRRRPAILSIAFTVSHAKHNILCWR
jgi:hypothetical protein